MLLIQVNRSLLDKPSSTWLAHQPILCEIWFVSDFVNYHKRDVQLPHGCKDLVEVLNLQPSANPLEGKRLYSGKLRDLPDYVTRLASSPKPSNSLVVVSRKLAGVHLFYRTKGGPLELHLTVRWHEFDQVKIIRMFFSERGFVAAQDYPSMGSQVFYYELPRVPELVSRLVIDLFADVYFLDDEAPVHFVFAP